MNAPAKSHLKVGEASTPRLILIFFLDLFKFPSLCFSDTLGQGQCRSWGRGGGGAGSGSHSSFLWAGLGVLRIASAFPLGSARPGLFTFPVLTDCGAGLARGWRGLGAGSAAKQGVQGVSRALGSPHYTTEHAGHLPLALRSPPCPACRTDPGRSHACGACAACATCGTNCMQSVPWTRKFRIKAAK